MQTIAEVMTPDVEVVGPEETLRDAARAMADLDVGSLPVCNGRKLIGMITDRDITIRAVAEGKSSETPVSEVMTDDVVWCTDTDSIDDVLQQMSDAQIRVFLSSIEIASWWASSRSATLRSKRMKTLTKRCATFQCRASAALTA